MKDRDEGTDRPEQDAAPQEGEAEQGEGSGAARGEQGTNRFVQRVREADAAPRLLKAARMLRSMMPGDSELGDPLSMEGGKPSQVVARTMAEVGETRPSVARELGLGALQMWQSVAEAQGRGRGDVELAILFTDLVEFSSWALEAGDEAALELLRQTSKVSDPAITSRGGRVVKRLGDGLMAVFPEPHEAVEAAREVAEKVGAVEVDGYRPQLRAGVHVGRPRKLGGDYLGVDVNVAARVAEAASGGQVLISSATLERLEPDAFPTKRVRRFKAKGAPKELEVYSVE